ncbi:hypothetical protein Scep_015874 [Stephania cephalantha]|uniref:Transmembrane protein n=1 Tax=Stephania cephalantha TaxID=152367 RepID=A0AAP0P1N7_9MAGN
MRLVLMEGLSLRINVVVLIGTFTKVPIYLTYISNKIIKVDFGLHHFRSSSVSVISQSSFPHLHYRPWSSFPHLLLVIVFVIVLGRVRIFITVLDHRLRHRHRLLLRLHSLAESASSSPSSVFIAIFIPAYSFDENSIELKRIVCKDDE